MPWAVFSKLGVQFAEGMPGVRVQDAAWTHKIKNMDLQHAFVRALPTELPAAEATRRGSNPRPRDLQSEVFLLSAC